MAQTEVATVSFETVCHSICCAAAERITTACSVLARTPLPEYWHAPVPVCHATASGSS